MPSCPRCGALLADRTAFCGSCGALIDRPNTAGPVDAGRPSVPASEVDQPSPIPAPTLSRPSADIYATTSPLVYGDVGVYIVRRFLALVVDLAGVGLLIGLGLVAYVDATRPAPDQFLALHARDFAIALGAAILAYRALAEALFGATLGKGLLGLGVGRVHGGRLGLARALVRTILLPLDLAVIGFLIASVTKARSRVGDLVAGSVVTNARIGGWAPVAAALAGAGAVWLLFANLDGARASSQLFDLAGFQLPADRVQPVATPEVMPTPTLPQPVATSTLEVRPRPSPSADPGRPVPI